MEDNKVKKINYKGETYISKTSDNIYEMLKEIVIYKNLDYPNIPKIKHILTNNNNTFEFLLDVYDKDLSKYIINPLEFKSFLTDMLLTLHYIHSKGIFHSDIKPDNILLKNNKYYLIDYGLSEFYGFPQTLFPYSGTPIYQAIDLNTKKDIDINSSFNLDVFSLAATSYEILTGRLIRDISNSKIQYDKNEITKLIGNEGSDLLENMVGLNNRYISTIEALIHPYLNISVDIYKDIAFKDNFNIKPTVNINFDKKDINHKMYIILINWLIEVNLIAYTTKDFQILLSCNKLLRFIISNTNLTTKNLQLYGISIYFICQILFTDYNSYDIYDIVDLNDNTYTKTEVELTIIDVMNMIDWKVEMIPYKIYLDFYVRKYFEINSDNYVLAMNICEMILMDLLFKDNDIKETLYELSYYTVDIVIYYMYNKNMKDLYLYNKTINIFNFIKTYKDINNYTSIKNLAVYYKL